MKAISILRKLPEAHASQIQSPCFISCSESFIHLGSVNVSVHEALCKKLKYNTQTYTAERGSTQR